MKITAVVEQYDPRIDKWTTISDDKEKVPNWPLAASIQLDKSIYCFSNTYEGRIFDIRTNKWNGSTAAVMERKEEIAC